jgi:hypothetical protein
MSRARCARWGTDNGAAHPRPWLRRAAYGVGRQRRALAGLAPPQSGPVMLVPQANTAGQATKIALVS